MPLQKEKERKDSLLFTVPRRELPCHAEQHRKAPGSVRRQKEQEESMGKSLYSRFPKKCKAREGRQV